MLTVPVLHSSGPSINEKLLSGSDAWKAQHLRSIELIYSHRPYFRDYYPELRTMLCQPYRLLADLNISLIHLFCHWLNIDTPISYSQNWNIQGHKTAMLVDMCDKIKATDYLSSPGETYVNKDEMNGYAHHFVKFTHPVYEQGHRTFLPNLSVIDLIFNCGPESGGIVRSAGHI